MVTKEEAKKKIHDIISEFEAKKSYYSKADEAEVETKLIEPLFEALGWTKNDFEKRPKVQRENKRGIADYAFKINGRTVFFLEAKKVSVDIDKDKNTWKQAISYALSKRIPFAVLTNFECIKIFCVEQENALTNQFRDLNYKEEYLTRFEDLWLLSRESFQSGHILEMAVREQRLKRRKSIDAELLEDLMHIRKLLANNIEKNHSQQYTSNEKDEIIQRILDRLLFIRKAEDIGINRNNIILKEISGFPDNRIHSELKKVFKIYDEDYNSGLFLHGRDNDCDIIQLDGDIVRELLELLYESKNKNYIYNFDWIDADVLGQVYEQYLGIILQQTKKGVSKLKEGQSHRKEQGIYYTPTYIVDFIVRNTLGEILKNKSTKHEKIRILDPACGSGSFLIKAFDVLNEYNVKNSKDYNQKTFDINSGTTFSTKEKILKNNIFGVDLDNKAVEIAQLNLLLKIAEKGHKLPLLKENIKSGNSLIDDDSIEKHKAFKWEKEFSNIIKEGKFDIVVGNPPYFNIKSDDILKNSKDFDELSNGVVNSASLFLKKGFDMLKDNGFLGFIIPKSFLIVDSWKPIRQLLLENSSIKYLYDVGMAFEEVGLEQVIIILQKCSPAKNNVKILKDGKEINSIPQRFFQDKGVLLTSLDKSVYPIILKLEKESIKLGDISDMPRGVTVNSSEFRSQPSNNTVHVLGGTNLERYKIKSGNKRKPNRYLTLSDKRLVQKSSIFKNKRIVYQNIASSVPKIIATIVQDSPTDDTLNNLIISDKSITYEYVLSVINSKLMTFYLRYAIINCSMLTIHLDKPYLGKIPIKKIGNEYQKTIVELVSQLISLNQELVSMGDKKTSERSRVEDKINRIENEINEMIYKIYNITKEERNIIENNLR